MDWIFLDSEKEYDGSQIKSLWAFKNFRLKEDSIIGFIGPCSVRGDSLVDFEDYLDNQVIYSPKMLHFIVEHFDEVSVRLICTRQHLLVTIVKDVLDNHDVMRKGDDLFYMGKKLSVSIATVSPVSAKIHFGINVKSDEYSSLEDIGYIDPERLGMEVCRKYSYEIDSLEEDIRKIRPNKCF